MKEPKKGRKREIDYGGLSQYECARRLGLSRARISQIELKAMRKLREALNAVDKSESGTPESGARARSEKVHR